MFKQTLMAASVAATLVPCVATGAETSPHTITGNAGLFSQYIFRGLTQTDTEPALQGGFDYAHASGFYAGTWGSNVSWIRDFSQAGFNAAQPSASSGYTGGASLELDIYAGYKGTIGKTDFGYDVGFLYYWYPGTKFNAVKADTLEVYGALSWKFLSAKFSYAISDEVFGVDNADGTYYLDLTATYPIPNTKLTLIGHYGVQKFSGTSPGGVDNDTFASYEDWKIGLNYSLPKDFTVGVFYTDTSMDSTQTAFYTTPTKDGGRELGKGAATIFVQKTF
jgi:uncharacterized protein (TIGR02001 family)